MATADLAVTRNATDRALRGKRVDVAGLLFEGALLICLLISLAFIFLLVKTVLDDGLDVFEHRGFVLSSFPDELGNAFGDTWAFFTEPVGIIGWFVSFFIALGLILVVVSSIMRRRWKLLIGLGITVVVVFSAAAMVGTSSFLSSNLSRFPENAGVAQAVFGSLVLALITALVAIPLGMATAVYLEEYAPDNRLTRFVRLNIRNLAGVPSVVYGLLGLAIFVQFLGTDFLGQDGSGEGITGGRTLIAGGLTLSVLVLPIVIITSSEALRAVPQSLREGGYGVGATKWEVTKTLVLPNAFAGILTGTILALSRAIGETAPLILVGAFFGTFFTTGNSQFFDKFTTTYTALPQVVYQWAGDAQKEFSTSLAAAAIVVLLGITMLANLTAVLLRNKYEKRW